MGALRKPAELHVLQGGASHRKINVGPKKRGDVGRCPNGESEAVRAKWRELRKEWSHLLSPQDKDALLIYCRTFVDWQEASKTCNLKGRYIPTVSGDGYKRAPWDSLEQQLAASLRNQLAHIGATPTSRQRVPGESATPKDLRTRDPSDLLT